jgi:glycerol-3-phosphate O-acyltransferase
MAKKSTLELHFEEKFSALRKKIPSKYGEILYSFFDCYKKALGDSFEKSLPESLLFLELIERQFDHPYTFEPYHRKIRHPIDYYRFGIDLIRPLIDLPFSTVRHKEHLEEICQPLKKGENVILLANHQTEVDPQVIAILLEKEHPEIGEKIIYAAGERVVTDPLAVPFSMGCDLLCIYSKRHIDSPPELKAEKMLHNKTTMEKMSSLLKEGGKIIYVAPSGGRDRKNEHGRIEVASFDPNSIEMFYLMARKAGKTTHFVPLALATYDLLPPPESIEKELGEVRYAKRVAVHLSFGAPFQMDHFLGSDVKDKISYRKNRALAVETEVKQMYQIIHTEHER